MQTRTSLRKHDVIEVSSIEYLTTKNRINFANFQVLDRSYYRIFNVRTIV